MSDQLTLFSDNAEYNEFTKKFVPKKTTDDCYTPANVYRAVSRWVSEEYGVDEARFLRPFKPGGDYEREEYPDGCVVVDNPPFSILKQIVQFYNRRGVPFFLFCPALTPPKAEDITIVATGCAITYENGAEVKTSFVTNLQPELVLRTAPKLYKAVETENKKNLALIRRQVPKYEYPDYIVTPAMAQKYGSYGVEYAVARSDAMPVRALDAQKAAGKSIFGHGYILSERAAAEKAAAEKVNKTCWELSDREREIIKHLGRSGTE